MVLVVRQGAGSSSVFLLLWGRCEGYGVPPPHAGESLDVWWVARAPTATTMSRAGGRRGRDVFGAVVG